MKRIRLLGKTVRYFLNQGCHEFLRLIKYLFVFMAASGWLWGMFYGSIMGIKWYDLVIQCYGYMVWIFAVVVVGLYWWVKWIVSSWGEASSHARMEMSAEKAWGKTRC